MGDVVLQLVLSKYGLLPERILEPAQVLVTTFGPEQVEAALRVSGSLRERGLRVEWYPEPARLPRQLRYADQRGIRFAIILGADELAKGVVALKDMLAREQVEVKQDELPAEIERRLAAPKSA